MSLLLVRGDRAFGARLMAHGHTVFLTDAADDIEAYGDIVDGYVDANEIRAVLYEIDPRRSALRERAVLALPADDADLSTFITTHRSTL